MSRTLRNTLSLLLILLVFACLLPAAYANGDALQELQNAIDRGDAKYTLTDDLTIPYGETVDARNTKIIVPNGLTLTVGGRLIIGSIDLQFQPQPDNPGQIIVNDGGELHATIWQDIANMTWTNWERNGSARHISFEDGAGFTLNRGDCAANLDALLFTLEDGRRNLERNGTEHLLFAFAIPADAVIDASETELKIACGIRLTVKGKLVTGSLEMESDGKGCGMIYVPAGGELHATQWTDIYNFLWDNWLQDGSAERFTYGENAGFNLHRWVNEPGDGVLGLARAFSDAANYCANRDYLRFHATLGFEWTVDTDTTIPDYFVIHAAYDMHVKKTLENNGLIDLGDWANLLLDENGSVSGTGRIERKGQPYDPISEKSAHDLFVEACSGTYNEPTVIFIPEGNNITLTEESVTVPENLIVQAVGSGFRLDGSALTVNGELLCSKFYTGGTLTVNGFHYVERTFMIGSGGTVHLNGTLSIEHDAFNPSALVWGENFFQSEGSLLDVSFNVFSEEELREIMFDGTPIWGSGFRRSFWMIPAWTLADDLEMAPETRICIAYGSAYEGSLLIPEGLTLTIPQGCGLYARGAGPETQQAVVEVQGALVNNGGIELDWGDTLGDIAIVGNGSYSGNGTVTRNGQPYDFASEHAAWNALVAACARTYDEYTEYDMEGTHVFTIRDGLIIPENLSVLALDSTFELTFPASLSIDGELIAGSLESFGETTVNGYLYMEKDCRILDNPVRINGEAGMTVDAWVNLWAFVGAERPDDVAAKFSFGQDALLDIEVEPADEEEFVGTLNYMEGMGMFNIPHIRETVYLMFPWTLDRNRALEPSTRLLIHYGGSYTGMLTIPEGLTLTVPVGSELFARGATEDADSAIVRVEGLLANDGRLTLQTTRAGVADVALIGKGLYVGSGEVERLGEPYMIWNNPSSADLILPADLTAIESEAFTGVNVRSVYIPANVQTIAADAFGDSPALIILCEPESTADTFVQTHKGCVLAPVA